MAANTEVVHAEGFGWTLRFGKGTYQQKESVALWQLCGSVSQIDAIAPLLYPQRIRADVPKLMMNALSESFHVASRC